MAAGAFLLGDIYDIRALLIDSFGRGENVGNGHSYGRSQWAVMGGNGATMLVGGVRGVLLLSKE